MKNLEELTQLNKRLTKLLEDPQLGLFTWHEALSEVLIKIAEFSPVSLMKTDEIKAECHTDDHVVSANFNACPWFERATDKDIVDLIDCGFRYDYPADAVAMGMAPFDNNVKEMFNYLEKVGCGFECSVDADQAIKWIMQNRPQLTSIAYY